MNEEILVGRIDKIMEGILYLRANCQECGERIQKTVHEGQRYVECAVCNGKLYLSWEGYDE